MFALFIKHREDNARKTLEDMICLLTVISPTCTIKKTLKRLFFLHNSHWNVSGNFTEVRILFTNHTFCREEFSIKRERDHTRKVCFLTTATHIWWWREDAGHWAELLLVSFTRPSWTCCLVSGSGWRWAAPTGSRPSWWRTAPELWPTAGESLRTSTR